MGSAHSRLTSQGQISIPAKIRQKLGVGPGSVIEWEEEGDRVVVRRAARYSSEEIHEAIFGKRNLKRRSLADLKDAVRQHIRTKYARD